MKSDYTGHPNLPELYVLEGQMREKLAWPRFNSDKEEAEATQELLELRQHIRKLELQGR